MRYPELSITAITSSNLHAPQSDHTHTAFSSEHPLLFSYGPHFFVRNVLGQLIWENWEGVSAVLFRLCLSLLTDGTSCDDRIKSN